MWIVILDKNGSTQMFTFDNREAAEQFYNSWAGGFTPRVYLTKVIKEEVTR